MEKKGWSKKRIRLIAGLAAVTLATILIVVTLQQPDADPENQNTSQTAPNNQPAPLSESPYTPVDLQPTIDAWVKKYPADYSIAVYDLQSGGIIGQNDPDRVLFAASLYKLYVAYFSLQDFQSGAQNPGEVLVAGQTKRQCVDKMIRESDSPCGEAMMADIGPNNLNQRAQSIGLANTAFAGIQTSAADAVKILSFIHQKEDLNDENTAFLLDAMLDQPARYKRGLQTGAPEAKWQTKVGWNLDINYHDVGIMTLPDGRAFAIAILGQGSGSPTPIADFAATIYKVLSAEQP